MMVKIQTKEEVANTVTVIYKSDARTKRREHSENNWKI